MKNKTGIMKLRHLALLLSLLLLPAATLSAQPADNALVPMVPDSMSVDTVRHQVLVETTMGNIRIALYNETPLHRDNFLKLVRNKDYDGMLFHRVIKNFMIQTGDPHSKTAKPGESLGNYQVGQTKIPAEIRFPLYYHKRGAVAAAREDESTNPKLESSGSQFYIVTGTRYAGYEMDYYERRLDTLSAGRYKFTPEQQQVYFKVGGAPYLDGQYTVFGEVVEGMDVVDRIQKVMVDDYARPVDDVRIVRVSVVK